MRKRRAENVEGRDRSYVLPFAGVGLSVAYLIVFSIYRLWGIGPSGHAPTDVKSFFLEPLAALRYTLGAETGEQLNNAVTSKQVVVWGIGTGLVMLSLLFSVLVSGYVIWNGPGRSVGPKKEVWTSRDRWLLTGGALFAALVAYPLVSSFFGAFEKFTVIARQLWGVIRSQLTNQEGLLNFINVEILIVALGYGVSATLVCASASTLLALPQVRKPAGDLKPAEVEEAANHVALKMKHLRLILYVGAILLVLITFRHRNTLNWALDYAKPLPLPLLESNPGFKNANLLYGNLEALVSNIVLATSVLNTLLLAGIYVPAALALQARAARLARIAVELEEKGAQREPGAAKRVRLTWGAMTEKQEEWIKSHGLMHPLKEQMPKAIAILSPLLAGPIGEVLNFFR